MMDAQTILDQIIFRLTPTRTRCELFVVAGDAMEKLASGLLKPYLSHLRTAEEQLATGGYSIKLKPLDSGKASWFTKGTAERFVRFVSSPEVIERVNTIETELLQLEETIRMQMITSSRVEDPLMAASSSISILGETTLSSFEDPRLPKKIRHDSFDSTDSGGSRNSKKQLLRALDARRLVLQKEQEMAFARAAAAGYQFVQMLQLIMFSDCFGATRLREACFYFVALCTKRQMTGFCIGDRDWIDEDIGWALSNTTCVRILDCLKEARNVTTATTTERIQEEQKGGHICAAEPELHDEWRFGTGTKAVEFCSSEKVHLPTPASSGLASLSPSTSPGFDWTNSTDPYQGWPVMYATNNPYANFQGYQYGFSPLSQDSFVSLPIMAPASATGLYRCPTSVTSPQLSDAQESLHMGYSSQERLPSLRKVRVGHRGRQSGGRMAVHEMKDEDSFLHGNDKERKNATDSSSERSEILRRTESVALQEECTSSSSVGDDSRQLPDQNRTKRSDSSHLSDGITEGDFKSFKGQTSGDLSETVRQNTGRTRVDRSYRLHHREYDAVQGSNGTFTDDNFSSFVDQRTLGSRLKKRLDFEESEAQSLKQLSALQSSKPVDDSFYVCSPCNNEKRSKPPPNELEVQGIQIYDRMSKQALKVNSSTTSKQRVTSKQDDPDDLLMMSKQCKRAPARDHSDVIKIDVELLKTAHHSNVNNSKKLSSNCEPSQERVKKFLNQYNEKREAKMRGEYSTGKRAERDERLKALRDNLENSKAEMARARRPGKTILQGEAQLRAEKLRSYKAGLQKLKKEKEDQEKRRLEELKAQRQVRIAARSNPNLSTARGRMSSQFPPSKVGGPTTRLPSQKVGASLPSSLAVSSSRQRSGHAQYTTSTGMPPRSLRSMSQPAPIQAKRSATLSVPRQTGKAGSGSQPSQKTGPAKAAQSAKANPVRSGSIFSAVLGRRENPVTKANPVTRAPSLRRSEPSIPLTRKKESVLSRPSLPSLRGQGPLSAKGVTKSSDEKQEGKTFLKKGSGSGSSRKIVPRPKPASPDKARAVDKRPLAVSGSGSKLSRLTIKEAKKSEGGGLGIGGSKTSNGFTSVGCAVKSATNDTGLSHLNQNEVEESQDSSDLVHCDAKPSRPRYSLDRGFSPTLATANKSSVRLGREHADMNLPEDPSTDFTTSRLMLFDRSCTMNGESSSNKQSLIFNTIFSNKSSHTDSALSSNNSNSRPQARYSSRYSSSSRNSYVEWSNGWENPVQSNAAGEEAAIG